MVWSVVRTLATHSIYGGWSGPQTMQDDRYKDTVVCRLQAESGLSKSQASLKQDLGGVNSVVAGHGHDNTSLAHSD